MFDAYTVKKVFPRLAIAIILIQLSWPLFTFMIFLVGQIAWGVEGLMYAPFGGRDALNVGVLVGQAVNGGQQGGGGSPELVIGALLGGAGVIGYGFALGALGLLSLAVTILIAVLIAFFVLAVRQVVLIVLLVLAPIALVAWVLPNTEKYWKLWWESFSKLLLMYPMILLLVAGGKVAAYIAAQVSASSKSPDAFGMAIVMIAWFAPYFLIPKTFQLAGSAFANIAGMANDKSRGAFDRLKNFRGQRMSERGARARSGDLFNNDRLNALTSRATTRNFGFGARGRSAYQQKETLASMEHAKSAAGQASQYHDGLLRAQTYGSEREAVENMGQDFGMNENDVRSAVAAARANGGFGRNRQIYAARQLAATGTGYDNMRQVARTIARVSTNADQADALAGDINSTTKTVGRPDLAPGFGTLRDLARREGGMATGDGAMLAAPTLAEYGDASVQAARGQDAVTLLRGKPADVENVTSSLRNQFLNQHQRANNMALSAADRLQAQTEMVETGAHIEELAQAKGYASPQNQEYVNALLAETEFERTGFADPVTAASARQARDAAAAAGVPPPATAQPQAGSLMHTIETDPGMAQLWQRTATRQRSPNDPNLPT